MALSLESIYKPINDFFLNRFKTDTKSPVFFKFDKFGSVVSDKDFTDPLNDPVEKFSDLVNRLPIEDSDGLNIIFSDNEIDETYFYRMLNPSIPFARDDDPNKDSIISAFSKIKADANKEWEKLSLARRGVPTSFRASYPTPGNWYDKTNNEIWTDYSFQASETTSTPIKKPQLQLWRLKVNDAVLQNVFQLQTIATIKPLELHKAVMVADAVTDDPVIRDHRTKTTTPIIRDHRTKTTTPIIRDHRTTPPTVLKIPRPVITPGKDFTAHATLQKKLWKLDLRKRYEVSRFIKNKAPTQTVTTNSIKVSFKFCTVNIRRSWLFDPFLNNESWFIPGTAKGQLSSADKEGSMALLPIGFIAIKNLSIEANWSDLDRVTAKTATDFGPFEVSSEIVNNKLSFEGIQIIGWLLQRMPTLPPRDPPQ